MGWLIMAGAGLTVIGLCVLFYCIYAAIAAKRAGFDDATMRDRLQKIVAINMAALLVSILGLLGVILGVFLG